MSSTHLAGLAAAGLLLAGCVEHRVQVTAASPPPPSMLIDDRILEGECFTRKSCLPLERRASAWSRSQDGTIRRAETVVATPDPWWQWFPCDLVTDLAWPGTLVLGTEGRLVPVPVVPTAPAILEAAAAARGYARRPNP